MKTRLKRGLIAGLLASALAVTGASLASASPAAVSDPGGSDTGTVQERTFTGTPEQMNPNSVTIQASCTFIQRVDNAHISTKSNHRAVQAHGNWGNVNCSYTEAVVTTMVQKKNALGIWQDMGTAGKATLRPASSLTSSARVTAHYACVDQSEHLWRSWTDVDVVGIADLPNRQYSPQRAIKCG